MQCIKQYIKIIRNQKKLVSLNKIKNNENIKVLILSDETVEINSKNKIYFNDIIYYDKLMNHMFYLSQKIYYNNYDYNFLEDDFIDFDHMIEHGANKITVLLSNILDG